MEHPHRLSPPGAEPSRPGSEGAEPTGRGTSLLGVAIGLQLLVPAFDLVPGRRPPVLGSMR